VAAQNPGITRGKISRAADGAVSAGSVDEFGEVLPVAAAIALKSN